MLRNTQQSFILWRAPEMLDSKKGQHEGCLCSTPSIPFNVEERSAVFLFVKGTRNVGLPRSQHEDSLCYMPATPLDVWEQSSGSRCRWQECFPSILSTATLPLGAAAVLICFRRACSQRRLPRGNSWSLASWRRRRKFGGIGKHPGAFHVDPG